MWKAVGGVALALAAGIWLETKLTGTSVTIDLLNPQKTAVASKPAASTHTSAQAGATNG